MTKNDDIELEIQEVKTEEPAHLEEEAAISLREEATEMKEHAKKAIQKIKDQVKEEDPKLTSNVTLRSILGGEFLTADMADGDCRIVLCGLCRHQISVPARFDRD